MAAHFGRVLLYACTKTFFDNSTHEFTVRGNEPSRVVLRPAYVRLSSLTCAPAQRQVTQESLIYGPRGIAALARRTGKRKTHRALRPDAPPPRGNCRAAAKGDHAKSGSIAFVRWDPYDASKTANPP
jgi:hypothetical protein